MKLSRTAYAATPLGLGFVRILAGPAVAEHNGEEHFWDGPFAPDVGTFGDPANWANGNAAPGPGEAAIFEQLGTFNVGFGANHTNDRLLVRDGDVTFDLGGHTYDLTNDHNPSFPPINPQDAEDVSLTVGAAAAGDRATLTLDSATTGSIVRGVQARIGQAAEGTDHEGGGTLNVRQSTLELDHRLFVGIWEGGGGPGDDTPLMAARLSGPTAATILSWTAPRPATAPRW